MTRHFLIASSAVFLFLSSSIAQNAVFPDKGTLYDGSLHSIHIMMHPDSLVSLLAEENRWTNRSYAADFVYDGTDTLFNVGIRIKGNTSRNAKKLSFKIDTDEFDDQSYQGLKTFNLNGNHNDPSLTRELLSAFVMNEAGVPSLRVNHIQLYINGVYRGVYSHAEHINKKFLSSRFGENNGNLYKCSWPAELTWLGAGQQAYKDLINPSPLNERAYELKTNEHTDDYSDLVTLINTINNTPQSTFKAAIDTIFDVDGYLKTLAAEILIGHWDNYFYNKNNYYLYHNKATRKFIYIPYDMDNTFGVQWGVSNIDTRNVNQWGNPSGSSAPLTNKILAVPEYKRTFELYIKTLCNGAFNPQKLYAKADSVMLYLDNAIKVDSFYSGKWESDYGYDHSDWQNSYTQAIDQHVTSGIKPYILNRSSSALSQIPPNTGVSETLTPSFRFFPNPASDFLRFEGIDNGYSEIMNTSGQKLIGSAVGPNSVIDLSGLTPGLYIITIRTGENVSVHKLRID